MKSGMSVRCLFLVIYLFSYSSICFSQENNKPLSKKALHERDSLMAVSILNLDSNFIFVQGGTFQMGLPDTSDVEGSESYKPQHKVTVNGFYILKTHVTQALWFSVMDTNPSCHRDCYNCPVDNISWYDAQIFIAKLNALKHGHYRLPTEAEFEYAARGGNKSVNNEYSGSNAINDVGWYLDNSEGMSHPEGQKKPNELGLADMSGNMWEWCSDWFDMNYYKMSPLNNPIGPAKGDRKVVRGGTWASLDEGCLVVARGCAYPDFRDKFIGFRIVKD